MKGGISKLNICSAQANKKSRYPVFETAGYRYSPKTSIRCLAKNVNTEDSIHWKVFLVKYRADLDTADPLPVPAAWKMFYLSSPTLWAPKRGAGATQRQAFIIRRRRSTVKTFCRSRRSFTVQLLEGAGAELIDFGLNSSTNYLSYKENNSCPTLNPIYMSE